MRYVAAAAVLLAATSCGGGGGGDVEWDKPWVDARGRTVHPAFVVSRRGPSEHCHWQSAVFLEVGWPLGRSRQAGAPTRLYVRDPENLFPNLLVSTFEDSASLPADARFTGYRRDDAQLWLSPSDADIHVYIVRGDDVERWPRSAKVFACA